MLVTADNAVTALNQLVQQGPLKGDMCKGLAKMRQNVLRHGVPAALDGMVSTGPKIAFTLILTYNT